MNSLFKNFNFTDWLVQNLLWVLFFSVIVVGIFKLILAICQAFITAKKILNKNRSTMGNGYGEHFADVFIEVWYKKNLKTTDIREYRCCYASNISSKKALKFQADKLQQLKLIKIKDEILNPIKNFRNKCVIYLIKLYLVHFVGDNKKYYQDLKK